MKRLMHYSITLIFGLLFFSVLSADAHLKAEQEVLSTLLKYFEARNNEDYDHKPLNSEFYVMSSEEAYQFLLEKMKTS